MERQNAEKGWNQLRYDARVYTIQNERNRRVGAPGEIPDQYRYIGDKCFLNNGKVHSVSLPAACRVIGKQAFEGCQFQKQVRFPDTLIEIKKRAFAGNRRLRAAVLPDSLEKIGAQCYRECSKLKRVEFSSGSRCRVIPEGIFDSCLNLEEVCLPPHTQQIEKRAFYRCKELHSIALPDSVREIGEEAFYFCRNRGADTSFEPSGDRRQCLFPAQEFKNGICPGECQRDRPVGVPRLQQTGADRDPA